MAGEFLSVPGNIKQIFLPFVLDPSNALNASPLSVSDKDGNSVNAGVGETQLFSFRGSQGKKEKDGFIRIAPNSFYDDAQAIVRDDISYKLLYGADPSAKGSVNPFTDILDNLPRITIREYLQDAKLDQVMNLFSSLGKGFDAGSAAASKPESKEAAQRSFLSKLTGMISSAINGGTVLIRNIGPAMSDIFGKVLSSDPSIKDVRDPFDDDYTKYVLKIPYLLYYRMLSATSTNIYEIPYSGQIMYEASGTGWNTKRHLIDGVEGSENSALGVLRNFVGKNIRVNTTPTWDGASEESGIKVDVEFSLFNDSLEGAIKNFIFVNTVVPGSMWMQYHIFQHAPNLYDIRIEGVKRLFMCQGEFKVESLGVLRKPSKKFCKELVSKHANTGIKITADDIEDLVKIPDIYKVTCTFTSLLPNNFNNYLYTYFNNQKITKISGNKIHVASAVDTVITDAAKELNAIFNYPNLAADAFESTQDKETGHLDDLIKKIDEGVANNSLDAIQAEENASAEKRSK